MENLISGTERCRRFGRPSPAKNNLQSFIQTHELRRPMTRTGAYRMAFHLQCVSLSCAKFELAKSSLANRNSFGDKSELPWNPRLETQC